MNENTTPWNRLQALLGLPNRTTSTVKKIGQTFDNKTQEHVIWIEYRAQVRQAVAVKPIQQRSEAVERERLPSWMEWAIALNKKKQA